jgi:hypothetical protein
LARKPALPARCRPIVFTSSATVILPRERHTPADLSALLTLSDAPDSYPNLSVLQWNGVSSEMNSQFNVISLSSEPHVAGPNAALSITMRSEINAISGAVDWLMTMIQECNCVPGQERDVEIALREALANAIPLL